MRYFFALTPDTQALSEHVPRPIYIRRITRIPRNQGEGAVRSHDVTTLWTTRSLQLTRSEPHHARALCRRSFVLQLYSRIDDFRRHLRMGFVCVSMLKVS